MSDIMSTYDDLSSDPRYDEASFGMVDLRSAKSAEYSDRCSEIHAAYGKAISQHLKVDNFRVGVVVTDDTLYGYVMSLIASSKKFNSSWERRTFATYEEAYSWASGES